MNTSDFSTIERHLNYHFKNPDLLQEALRHRSFVNEQPAEALTDNERLEFLGDAVLNLFVSHVLMDRFPEMTEGDLSRTRAALVNELRLAELARSIDLGPLILLGKGERLSGGPEKNSILSDTFEALIAAVYLDGGFRTASDVLMNRFGFIFDDVECRPAGGDYKSRLQELAQTQQKIVPSYRVIKESGPDHDKTFDVELTLDGISTTGTGKSKKLAEQEAAREALRILESAEE
ncbi:MAG: ribonuclease III [Desulfobacterales bacterium]|jgi:ribonuclease III